MFSKLGIGATEVPWIVTAVAVILVFGYLLTRNIAPF